MRKRRTSARGSIQEIEEYAALWRHGVEVRRVAVSSGQRCWKDGEQGVEKDSPVPADIRETRVRRRRAKWIHEVSGSAGRQFQDGIVVAGLPETAKLPLIRVKRRVSAEGPASRYASRFTGETASMLRGERLKLSSRSATERSSPNVMGGKGSNLATADT